MRKYKFAFFCFGLLFIFTNHLLAQQSKKVTCTGKVVDEQGLPIAGAKVAAYEMQFDGIAGNFMLHKAGDVTTTEDGKFIFTSEPKPERSTFHDCKIVAVKEGLALGWTIWNMREDAELNIELGKPKKLEGIIVDELGEPVTGAGVYANLIKPIKIEAGEEKKDWLPGIEPMMCLGTHTDNQGKFGFTNLPEDTEVGLLIKADGMATTYTTESQTNTTSPIRTGQSDIKLIAIKEGRIEGKITDPDTGRGVGGTKFAVVATSSGLFYYRFVLTTNDDGTFDIGGLQTGQYLIRGDFPSVNVDVVSGKSTSDVLIVVNRQEDKPTSRQIKIRQEERLQIYLSMRILEVPSDVNTDIFEQNNSISNGIFVRSDYEFAGTLLELAQQNEDVKLLSSPQLLTFIGEQASISMASKEYVSGYKLADDGSGKLLPKMESFNTCDYKIKGVLKDDNWIHLTLSGSLREPVFETRQYKEGYDYQIPLPGRYFSVEGTTKNNEPLTVGLFRPDKPVLYLIITPSCLFPEPVPESLIGKVFPGFDNISNVEISDNFEGKSILVCFFDMEQRPSRNCLMQLSKRAQELKAKDIIIISIQASKIEKEQLNKWLRNQNISLPVGIIETSEKETCLSWGVKSLPWMILTDKQHVVTTEGFSISELNEKIKP